MFPVALAVLFVVSAIVTSALAYDEKRWRYPALTTCVSAALLTAWGTGALRLVFKFFSSDLYPAIAAVAAALPFCFVIAKLVRQRRMTPRHIPSVNDDPVLRRYLEEKVRRRRKQRQTEEALENEGSSQ